MDYIKRTIEEIIDKSSKTFKAVLVTGARQTGKSTVLKNMYPDIKSITFDDPFLEEQAKHTPDMFMMLNEPPIFLDEIQYVPSLFCYIKISCDATDSILVYLAAYQVQSDTFGKFIPTDFEFSIR